MFVIAAELIKHTNRKQAKSKKRQKKKINKLINRP